MKASAGMRGWLMVLPLVFAAGCSTPKPQFTDGEWISHTTTGRGSYERGDFRRASKAFAKAEDRARAMDDADALAVSAVNRAVCLIAEGAPDAALPGLREALADPRVASARRVELQIMISKAELAAGRSEAAGQAARAALDEMALAKSALPLSRAQAGLALSAAELAGGQTDAADAALENALPEKQWRSLPAAIRAERAVRRAEIAAFRKDLSGAAAEQAAAAELYRRADRLPEMAGALVEAGWMNRAAGNLSPACDQFYRAARSFRAQGLARQADAALKEAVLCADELGQPEAQKRVAELKVTFSDENRLNSTEDAGE